MPVKIAKTNKRGNRKAEINSKDGHWPAEVEVSHSHVTATRPRGGHSINNNYTVTAAKRHQETSASSAAHDDPVSFFFLPRRSIFRQIYAPGNLD